MATEKTRPIGRLDAQGRVIPDSFLDESFRGEYTGIDLIYAGFARPGASESAAVWQITKMAYDGANNIVSIKWPQTAGGIPSNDYEFIWANRATYTFS